VLVGQPPFGFSITSPFKQAARAVRYTVAKPAELTMRATRAAMPFPLPGRTRYARRRRTHHSGWSGVDDEALGFSITAPFKKVGSAVKTGVKYTVVKPTQYAVKGTKIAAKAVYKAHAIPTQWLAIKPTMWLAEKATAPVKKRVQTLVNRRAAKLAWDRRKSKTPTPAEHNEARTWTRNRLLKMSVIVPAAPLLAAFAGAPDDYQLGIAPAVVAAAVPVLLAAAAVVLQQLAKSGEAPANPTDPGAPAPPPPPGADGGPPPQPGEVDLTPVQDAAAEAAEQGAEAMQQVAAQAGGRQRVGGMTLPKGISKNHMLIGGALLGGVLLIAMLKPKSGGKDKD